MGSPFDWALEEAARQAGEDARPRAKPRRGGWCRHCHRRPASRPCHLCRGCYYRPGVRDRYRPPRRTVADRNGERPLPSQPTAAGPGTEDKIAVLALRAARAEALWHPADAGWEARAHEYQPAGTEEDYDRES